MSGVVGQARATVASGVGTLRRITPAAILLRVMVWLAGVAALVLATPVEVLGPEATVPVLVVAGAVALVPALFPGSWLVLAMELVALAGWLVRTSLPGSEVTWTSVAFTARSGLPVAWLAVVALAAALYVHHSASALAATVPLDVRPLPGSVARWLTRTGALLGATAVVAALALLLQSPLGKVTEVAVPVLGVLVALVVAGALAYVLRRPSRGRE
ncbi:MAG TPA: hypothetical protein VE287_00990 [Actinopolymorphaceae bacterium]|nr:hypothetical protein [Actinopolymorphaceae bacterium]